MLHTPAMMSGMLNICPISIGKPASVTFEAGLPMDIGQILSIQLIIAGVWSIDSRKKRDKAKNVEAK